MPMNVKKWQVRSRWIAPGEVLTRIAEIEAKLAVSSDFRERKSHGKALAFCCTSVAVSDAVFSTEDLARIIAAGYLAKRIGGATELLNRTLLHLVRRRLDLLGVGEPVTLAEKKRRVAWDSGCLAVGANADVVRTIMRRTESEILGSINAGALYMVNIGSDGSAPLTLRVVEFAEPMLPIRELTKTEAVSELGWLHIENGVMLAGAPEEIGKGVQLTVPDGRYVVRLFNVGSVSQLRLVVVACRSAVAIEELSDIPSV